MAGTLRQGQSEFFQLSACQHGSDLRCRPSPTARLELLDTNTGLPAGPLYLLGVIPLIQQRPLPPQSVADFESMILVDKAIVGREIECDVLGNDDPAVSLPCEVVLGREF